MKLEANSTGCPNMGTMHKQSWVPLEFLTKMRDICSKHSTLLQMLVLNPVSWILYQVFSLLISFGVVKDKRLSSKFEKSIQHQRLIHHSIKRKTNWEMRRTLVSDPEITPTYDCGAVLLGAVIIFYLYRKKKFKLHEVSIESSIISASSKEGVTRNLLLLLAMSMEMYRIWHEASLVEMRENHYVVVFKELQMAGDVELNPGPCPPELLARLINDFGELRPEYYSLGVQLKVPVYIVEVIKSDTGDRLAKIFDHWLHNTQEDLWFEQLFTALQRMHRSDLATIVEQKYMKSTKGASNTAVSLESALKQSTAIASPGITKDGSKVTAKLQKYISDIQEQYQKHLDKQIDSEIICDVAKHLHSWDAKYNLLNLDYDKVKVIKEENSSSVILQRITALNHWKDRVGPDCTYRNLLRILALGDWHDSANKVITFINNGSCHRQIAHSSSSQQWEGREPANKKDVSRQRRPACSSSEQLGRRSYFASGQKRYSEQSETIHCSKYPRREDSSSDTEADIITNLTAEELADWLHSRHKLPEDACKIIKDQSINGSVFVDLTKEHIDSLGFNFGACHILLKVLNQIKEHQPARGARVTSRTELDIDNYSEICNQLHSVKHQWEDIALALGFKYHEIEKIRRDVSFQISGNQLNEVISFWLRWGPKDKRGSKDIATLEALQEALKQTNNARVEVKISMNSAKQ